MSGPRALLALTALCALPRCERAAAPTDATARDAAELARDAASPTPDAPPRGVSHDELLRRAAREEFARMLDRSGPGAAPPVDPPTSEPDPGAPSADPSAPTDGAYANEQPVDAQRARYELALPDEQSTLPLERALLLDDGGERASVTLLGNGTPAVPGLRVSARAGWLGLVLSAASGGRYRVVAPEQLQRYLLGQGPPRPTAIVSFRRTARGLFAARGGIALALEYDREGPTRPLPCRLFVALFLGGELAATRAACADALPVRALTLRASGFVALTATRAEQRLVHVPRAVLAVPPADAAPTLPLPERAPSGAFYAPSELAALGGVRRPEHALEVTNLLDRELLVFVDDVALGWVGAAQTARFEGLAAGRHPVRFRSLDGAVRTPVTEHAFPITLRPGAPPGEFVARREARRPSAGATTAGSPDRAR